LNEKGIVTIYRKLEHKGLAMINNMYPTRALKQIGSLLNKHGILEGKERIDKVIDLEELPRLRELLVNKNLQRIADEVSDNASLAEVRLYQYIPEAMLEWSQGDDDFAFKLLFFLEHSHIPHPTFLSFPGSHQKKLGTKEREIITENSVPGETNLDPGGAVLMKPLLISRFSDEMINKKVRLVVLGFGV
jgi:hypothetical protein